MIWVSSCFSKMISSMFCFSKTWFSILKWAQSCQTDSTSESGLNLLSRMVGLFLCRIFLNFPLKSRGGKASKLARRPGTTWSCGRAVPVPVPLRASELMLAGGEPRVTSIILPCEEDTFPWSSSFLAPPSLFLLAASLSACSCVLSSLLVSAVEQVSPPPTTKKKKSHESDRY